jgi:hypothetical protein
MDSYANNLIELQDYFINIPPDTTFGILIKIIVVVFLCLILSRLYLLFGNSFSDRFVMAGSFVMLALVTMLVITVVKSSLALSLGLVGALSIVRFRTPIKEPEDLIYLFLAIAIGLGVGASSIYITTLISLIIFIIIFIRGNRNDKLDQISGMSITIVSKNDIDLKLLVPKIENNCKKLDLYRYDKNNNINEVTFSAELDHYAKVENINQEIKTVIPDAEIVFTDNSFGRMF